MWHFLWKSVYAEPSTGIGGSPPSTGLVLHRRLHLPEEAPRRDRRPLRGGRPEGDRHAAQDVDELERWYRY